MTKARINDRYKLITTLCGLYATSDPSDAAEVLMEYITVEKGWMTAQEWNDCWDDDYQVQAGNVENFLIDKLIK